MSEHAFIWTVQIVTDGFPVTTLEGSISVSHATPTPMHELVSMYAEMVGDNVSEALLDVAQPSP